MSKLAATLATGKAADKMATSGGPITNLLGTQTPAMQFVAGTVVSLVVVGAAYTMLGDGAAPAQAQPEATTAASPAAPVETAPTTRNPVREQPKDDPLLRPFAFPEGEGPAAAADAAKTKLDSRYLGVWIVQGREAGAGRYEGEVVIEPVNGKLEVQRVVHYDDGKTVRWKGVMTDSGKAVNFSYGVRAMSASLSMHEVGSGAPTFVNKKLKGRFTVHDNGKVLRGYVGSGGDYVEVLRRPSAAGVAAASSDDPSIDRTTEGMAGGLEDASK